MNLRVYIGHDRREQAAFDVAEKTAKAFGCQVIPVYEGVLRASGMLTRPMDRRGGMWDINSNAPQSTDFAIARFFVPLLAHSGWCLFVDCDVVFRADPHQLLEYADESKAVCVVKFAQMLDGAGKMDGQKQLTYPRKWWSSLALWNCSHVANKRLNLQMLNQWHRDDLHAFQWLADSEIGELPAEWNHLVGVMPYSDKAKLLHFTRGTPNMPGFEDCEYAEVWHEASQR